MKQHKEYLKAIADAIRERDGTAEPIVASAFPERIRAIPGGGEGLPVPLDPAEVYKATRPRDWLRMPPCGEGELYLLCLVPEGGSSLLAFTVECTGSYTVSVGTAVEGAFVEQSSVSVPSGQAYETELLARDLGDLTADGMKQALVRVSGEAITAWQPSVHSQQSGDLFGGCLVEMAGRLPAAQSVVCTNMASLRYFSLQGENQIQSAAGMFSGCLLLAALLSLDTSKVTDFSDFLAGCEALVAIPPLDTGNGRNFSFFAAYCYALTSIPPLDFGKAENTEYAFDSSMIQTLPPMPFGSLSEYTFQNSTIRRVEGLGAPADWSRNTGTFRSLSFAGNAMLEAITLDPEVRIAGSDEPSIDLSSCSLGHEAMVKLLESLPEYDSAGTIRRGRIILTDNRGSAQLTEEEKAIATGKGWTLTLN